VLTRAIGVVFVDTFCTRSRLFYTPELFRSGNCHSIDYNLIFQVLISSVKLHCLPLIIVMIAKIKVKRENKIRGP